MFTGTKKKGPENVVKDVEGVLYANTAKEKKEKKKVFRRRLELKRERDLNVYGDRFPCKSKSEPPPPPPW